MFKVGDYVMGKDRSYARSLYRVHEILNTTDFNLQFIILGGVVGKGEDHDFAPRKMSDFQLASAQDIKRSFGHEHMKKFFALLYKLDLMKSSQVRRSFGLQDFQQ